MLTIGAVSANAVGGLEIYDNAQFSIPLKIGNGEMRGLWDTGAGLTAIDQEYVAAHPQDFKFIADVPGGDGAGIPMVFKLYKAVRVDVAGHTFTDVGVLAMDFSVIREYFSNDVFLVVGFNLISRANWFFDLQKRTWEIF